MSDADPGSEPRREDKAPDAFRTISEVAEDLELPQHVLRFWETRFTQIKPLKRGGGRRYYRPQDVDLLRGIRHLLYGQGYTIRGVQRILRERGLRFVVQAGQGTLAEPLPQPSPDDGIPDQDDLPGIEPATPRAGLHLRPAEDEDDGVAAIAQRIAGRGTEMPPPAALGAAVLAPDEVRRLEATLSDLLECKRLLDQAR
ncbi:MAG: MerR family transcriptional regulator [Bauldia sp.]